MARKFLSFLGTSNYTLSNYSVNGEIAATNYIQEALIKCLCRDWGQNDEAVIFLTDKARNLNWDNESDSNRQLKNRLSKYNIKVKEVDIPIGKNEEEIKKIFTLIYNSLDDGDEIIFDITHSFRSITLLALVSLNYARVLKNIKIKGIYYGAFEAKDENGITPVFDLTSYNELILWSHAVNTFTKYGNANEICGLMKEIMKNPESRKKNEIKKLKDFSLRLKDFTNTIYTCRGKYVGKFDSEMGRTTRCVHIAYNDMKKELDDVIEDKNLSQSFLQPLFEKISVETDNFKNDDNFYTGLAVVRWSIKNNLIQQAYTALEETIVTYLCKKYNYDETSVDCRESIVTSALRMREKLDSGEIKSESEWNMKQQYHNDIVKIANSIESELTDITKNFKRDRNDISHFGYTKDAKKYTELNEGIKRYFNAFIEYVSKDSRYEDVKHFYIK